jgi:tetratricopeptide (TPR) repeat protein
MIVDMLSSWPARLAAGALVVAGAVAGVVFAPAILLRAAGGGEDLRVALYASGVRMFQASPLVGLGPGTWVVERPTYTLTSEIDYFIPHAHDIYFQTIAEFGLLGIVGGLVALLCLAWLIRDGITDADPVRRRFGWAALFATAYFAAHQLLDFYPNMPATLFAWAIPIAYLDATSRRPILTPNAKWLVAWGSGARPIAGVLAVVVLVSSVAWLAKSEAAAAQMDRGVTLANAGNWSGALPLFRDAAAADPAMPPYQLAVGIAAANTGDLKAAADALARSTRADNLPAAWLDLASVRADQGDGDGARDALIQALRLGHQVAAINMGAGAVLLSLGDEQQATAAFALAIDQIPSLAGDPWWQSSPALATIWPDILAQAVQEYPGGAFEIALSTGDRQRAQTAADLIADPASREFAGLVIQAWFADKAATDALYARAGVKPLDPGVLGWAARVASRSGDYGRAAAFRSWANTVSPDAGTAGFEVRVRASHSSANLAGIGSLFYGHYLYRRPTPWDLLVTSLPQIVYQ